MKIKKKLKRLSENKHLVYEIIAIPPVQNEVMTIEKLHEFMKEIKSEVIKHESDYKRMSMRLTKVENKSTNHQELLVNIKEHEVLKRLDEMRKAALKMRAKVNTELLKSCVASEVARLHPFTLPLIIKAMQKTDDWWRKRNNLTIAEWIVVLKNLSNEDVEAKKEIPLKGK